MKELPTYHDIDIHCYQVRLFTDFSGSSYWQTTLHSMVQCFTIPQATTCSRQHGAVFYYTRLQPALDSMVQCHYIFTIPDYNLHQTAWYSVFTIPHMTTCSREHGAAFYYTRLQPALESMVQWFTIPDYNLLQTAWYSGLIYHRLQPALDSMVQLGLLYQIKMELSN